MQTLQRFTNQRHIFTLNPL